MINEMLSKVFDYSMVESIKEYAHTITNSSADIYVVMARKAACFLNYLERHGMISFDGEVVTDRILDINSGYFVGKDIIVVDDVVVSGTTIYNVIQRLLTAGAKSVNVFVLGVNTDYFAEDLFLYKDAEGKTLNYIQKPYIRLTDAGCMRVCSNLVTTFALDLSPYDVDFPRHSIVSMSKKRFDQITSCPDWKTYDVSSDIQSEYGIDNISFLPTERLSSLFDHELGIPVSKLGFFKIRIFAKYNNEKKNYAVNAVPYYLFNEITSSDINMIFGEWFGTSLGENLSTLVKMRILQYILAEKLFAIWNSTVNVGFSNKQHWRINKPAFCMIFPKTYYESVMQVIFSSNPLSCNISTTGLAEKIVVNDTIFESKITMCEEKEDNMAVLQTKLIEPFTHLYFTKEKESRRIVLKNGKQAFEQEKYQNIIQRLNHGYSYHTLLRLLDGVSDLYDKTTTVSLFIDEAVDAGIIVPIIAEEYCDGIGTYYFRAYRHGEDVPFGELQEKLCAIFLTKYAEEGGPRIFTKLRIEKLLVLFLKIGIKQGIFTPNTQDTVYYNVNVDAYLQGNILTMQDFTSTRQYHYLVHRTDAMWLSDVLRDKGIIQKDRNDFTVINDNIDISIDTTTKGKVAAIGKTFAKLFKNGMNKKIPSLDDHDMVILSTCMSPQDILNALAAELAIFENRWHRCLANETKALLTSEPEKIIDCIRKSDMYEAVNSGQKKFFDFTEKKAQKRIQEISQQLEMDNELSIYGTQWDQFWADNRDWDWQSIDPELKNTILNEGARILIINLVCRLLFYCVSDRNDVQARENWKKETEKYRQKMYNSILSKRTDISKILTYSERVLMSEEKQETVSIEECNNLINIFDYYASITQPLLSNVQLLVDRHGKICKINRYIHAIYLSVPSGQTEAVCGIMGDYYSNPNGDSKYFVIREPDHHFSKAGIWYFLKQGNIADIKKMAESCFVKCAKMCGVSEFAVFFNLSDQLRLKCSGITNTKIQNGLFCAYSRTTMTPTNQREASVLWIYENSKANRHMANFDPGEHDLMEAVKQREVAFHTSVSETSTVLEAKLLVPVDTNPIPHLDYSMLDLIDFK